MPHGRAQHHTSLHQQLERPSSLYAGNLISSASDASGMNSSSSSADPKPRLRWTPQLHERFVDAVTQLGGADSKLTSFSNPFSKFSSHSHLPLSLPHTHTHSLSLSLKTLGVQKQHPNLWCELWVLRASHYTTWKAISRWEILLLNFLFLFFFGGGFVGSSVNFA